MRITMPRLCPRGTKRRWISLVLAATLVHHHSFGDGGMATLVP